MVRRITKEISRLKVLLAHTPQMRRDYYGERSLSGLRAVAELKLHEGDMALDAAALIEAADGVDIIVADRMTQGRAKFSETAETAGLRALRGRHPQHRCRGGLGCRRTGHAGKPRLRAVGRRACAGLHGRTSRAAFRARLRTSRGHGAGSGDGAPARRQPDRHHRLWQHRRYLAGIAKMLDMEVLVADPFVTIDDATIRHVPLDYLLSRRTMSSVLLSPMSERKT